MMVMDDATIAGCVCIVDMCWRWFGVKVGFSLRIYNCDPDCGLDDG